MNRLVKVLSMIAASLALLLCIILIVSPEYSEAASTEEIACVSLSDGSSITEKEIAYSEMHGIVAPTKEEVVYAELNGNGTLRSCYVVNGFTLSGGGEIIDFGNYSSVQNMTTTDKITQNGDTVSIVTDADKLYYEGQMDNAVLPWNIVIRYFLNGSETAADELAGKSGKLKIQIKITENVASNTDFFDNYALQLSMTLDGEKCNDISASNATIANVGSDKQITYTVLPGEGLDAEVTALVTNFEMEGISINGIGLSLDIDVDTSEVTERIIELQDGATELNNGAGDLSSGVDDLLSGTTDLQSGASELHIGAETLYNGLGNLASGISELQEGLDAMKTGASDIQEGLDTLSVNSNSIRSGSSQVSEALADLNAAVSEFDTLLTQLETLSAGSKQVRDGIDTLYTGISGLNTALSAIDVSALQSANNASISALENAESTYQIDLSQVKNTLASNNQALGVVSQAQAATSSLLAGVTELKTNYAAVDDGIQALYGQRETLNSGLQGLKTSIAQLETAYNGLVDNPGLDAAIQSYTQGVDNVTAGYEYLYAALYGSNGISSGADSLADGITAAQSASNKIADGADTLYEGIKDLKGGVQEAADGAHELKSGTQELFDETSGMDDEINNRIDEIITELSGSDFVPVSFVSPKNTSVQSVQFVMKTDEIRIIELDDSTQAEVSSTFLDKLLALFG